MQSYPFTEDEIRVLRALAGSGSKAKEIVEKKASLPADKVDELLHWLVDAEFVENVDDQFRLTEQGRKYFPFTADEIRVLRTLVHNGTVSQVKKETAIPYPEVRRFLRKFADLKLVEETVISSSKIRRFLRKFVGFAPGEKDYVQFELADKGKKYSAFTEEGRRILCVLTCNGTVSQVAKETLIPYDEVKKLLRGLKDAGFVKEVNVRSNCYGQFKITNEVRELVLLPSLSIFSEVYGDELQYLQKRRQGETTVEPGTAKDNLIGLALSGGGIRSATSCLGMLQALSKMGVLPLVDYLSTVSGGGYIGSCLSALLSVNSKATKTPGGREQFRLGTNDAPLFSTEWKNFPFNPAHPLGKAEIKHLRTHGDFLMARQGLFARETLRSIGNLLTGLVYHLIIVLLFLFAISALYLSVLDHLAPNLFRVLDQQVVVKAENVETTTLIETVPQPPFVGPTKVIETRVEREHNSPTLWQYLKQTSPVWRRSVRELRDLASERLSWFSYLLLGVLLASFLCLLPPLPRRSRRARFATFSRLTTEKTVGLLAQMKTAVTRPGKLGLRINAPCQAVSPEGHPLSWLLALLITLYSFWRGLSFWPLAAFILGAAISLSAFLWLRVELEMEIRRRRKRARIKSEEGESEEDAFEQRSLLWAGVVAVVLAIGGAVAIRGRWTPVTSQQDHELILRLFLPLLICIGAWLTGFVLSTILPHGEYLGVRLGSKSTKRLWTRDFRSLWGAFQGMIVYSVVFSSFFAFAPLLIFALVKQRTLGLKTGLGGASLALLVGRPLLSRLTNFVEEKPEKQKKLSPGFLKFALGMVVAVFLSITFFGFCTLIVANILEKSWDPWISFVIAFVPFVIVGFGWGIDFNRFALHYFYRDRLIETYLRTEKDDGTGRMQLIFDAMEMPLTDLHGNPKSQEWRNTAPYHLVSTAINLTGSRDLTRRTRKSGYFLFSKLYCGSQQTGYQPTRKYREGETKLALAMTISGAAVASVAGYYTFFAQSFLAALLNARLGYWVLNPRRQTGASRWSEGGPRVFWPFYLAREMFAKTDSRSWLVNLSDGGHTGDNIGVYPLLQRRCKVIIACDAEKDEDLTMGSFTEALRQAYIDMGIDVDIDLSMIRRDPQTGLSPSHCAIGNIAYPDRPGQKSWLIYMKNSLTGDEPETVKNYASNHRIFPHQTTGDEFFDDNQFESYRALGFHIAEQTFSKWVSSSVFGLVERRHSPFSKEPDMPVIGDEDEAWGQLQRLFSLKGSSSILII